MRKGEATKIKLLNGIIECLGRYGAETTTFQKVADHCGVSQALVVKSFKNRENMIWSAFVQLLTEARALTLTTLENPPSASEMLRAYIDVSLRVFTARPETPRLYVLLYYLASTDARYLQFNTDLKAHAVERIKLILDEGVRSGEFVIHGNSQELAKTIHSSLTGLLLNAASESTSYKMEDLGEILFQQIRGSLSGGIR